VDLSEQEFRKHPPQAAAKDSGLISMSALLSAKARHSHTLAYAGPNGLMWLPVHNSWRLNERHYGALQGSIRRTAKKFSDEQVHTCAELRHPSSRFDQRGLALSRLGCQIQGAFARGLPLTESLN